MLVEPSRRIHAALGSPASERSNRGGWRLRDRVVLPRPSGTTVGGDAERRSAGCRVGRAARGTRWRAGAAARGWRRSAASSGASSGRPRTPSASRSAARGRRRGERVELRRRRWRGSSTKRLDAFARLGRHCGDSVAARSAADEVEFAVAPQGTAPRDLDHARELDLAQLDRRSGERAHDGGGVLPGRSAAASRRVRLSHLCALERCALRAHSPARSAILEPDTVPRIRGRGVPDRATLCVWT